jgi:hypothetical protein
VTTDLDTLATALYVNVDDLLKESPRLAPWRPRIGIAPRLSDAELVTLAVMQALLGFTSEARWLRYAQAHLRSLIPYLPQQPGYNKRLRTAAALIRHVTRVLGSDTDWWSDDVWVVDSTPVECGRSRKTAQRSELAGWAEYGYCASHTRYFWGLRLHLVCTMHGLPITYALTGAKADERDTLLGMLSADPDLVTTRPGLMLMGDKNYFGSDFEAALTETGITLLRPTRKGEPERPGARFFKPLRQIIESINATLKAQLDLEAHGGHTPAGVIVRVLQRILALTSAQVSRHARSLSHAGGGEHRPPTQFALVVVSRLLVGALTCDGELRKERLIRMSERSRARAASRVGAWPICCRPGAPHRARVAAGSIIGGCGT